MICKYFLPFLEWPFYFVDCILQCIEVLNFDVVQLICFFLLLPIKINFHQKNSVVCIYDSFNDNQI